MSNTAALYWLTRVDDFSNVLIGAMVVLSGLGIVFGLIWAFSVGFDEESTKLGRKWFKTCLIIIPFLAITNAFIPSQKEAILIVAGGKTLDFIGSDTSIQKIPGQTTKIVSDFLEQQIKNLNQDAKQETTTK